MVYLWAAVGREANLSATNGWAYRAGCPTDPPGRGARAPVVAFLLGLDPGERRPIDTGLGFLRHRRRDRLFLPDGGPLAGRPVFPRGDSPVVKLFRLKSSNDRCIELEFQKLLDTVEKFALILAHQRNCVAFGAGTAGAADPMNIILRRRGQLKVDHMRQVFNVESARGHVGRHQHADHSFLEFRQRLGALRLGLIAVNGRCSNAVAFQLLRQAAGTMLGANKNQYLFQVLRFDQVCQ